MATTKKAASAASTPPSAPASVGAPPSPDLSDLAAAMAAEDAEIETTAVLPAPSDTAPLYSLTSAPLGAGAGDLSDSINSVTAADPTIALRDVTAPLTDVSEGGTVLTVLPSEEVTDLKNKVSALLDDLDAANARVERHKGEAVEAASKLAAADAQLRLMDEQLTALSAENEALRKGAPVAEKAAPATVKPTSIPVDFDLFTWGGPGVYEGLCFRLTGESLPRARGTMTGYFPRSMAKKFPHLFTKAA